jgi:hypothetical protein
MVAVNGCDFFEAVGLSSESEEEKEEAPGGPRPELPRFGETNAQPTCHRQGEVRTTWLSKRKAPAEPGL